MLQNYFSLALRNLRRNSVFTLINGLGLCLGMTAFLLITQYVTFEKSYNSFHANLPTLYRTLIQQEDGEVHPYTAPGIAPVAVNEIPDMNQFCRLAEGASLGTGVVGIERAKGSSDAAFRENRFVYADGQFFNLFSFPLIEGKAAELEKPNVVALSRSTSVKYFGQEPAVGKVLSLNNQFGTTLYTVELVFEDMPENSDLQYDLVFSLQTLSNPANLNGNESWASIDGTGSQWLFTYVQLKPEANAETVASQYSRILQRINPEEKSAIKLQQVSAMHLGESITDTLPTFGSLRFVYLLAAIALLILVIAWFNYVNLSTASAMKRAKEVGIRKVVGASKAQVAWQFLGESVVLNACALTVALALVSVLQTPYAVLTGKHMTLDFGVDGSLWINAGLVLIIGSLASGAYTAFVLSSFRPSRVLKGVFSKSTKGVLIRKSLVVVQFAISLMLIAATVILYQQWKYMENKDLGMNPSRLVIIRGASIIKDERLDQRSAVFENEIRNAAFVEMFSRSGNIPTQGFNFSTAGITRLNPRDGDEKVNYDMLTTDERYLDTYGIGLVAGQNFTPEMCAKPWNEMAYLILNERASELMGFPSAQAAVGEKVKWGDRIFEVRGVARNYHHQSVQYAIGPMVLLPSAQGNYYTLRLASADLTNRIATLESLYKQNFPGNPFEFQFVDDTFAARYTAERQYSIVFTLASSLAIFIGCLGLFGLATYSIEQRTKEIGVRKVLGSTVAQIVNLLSGDFIRLIVIAFIIAAPLTWWIMERWLQGFAYRIDIAWWVFALAGLVTGTLAWLTVSVQAIKGAMQNPVTSLRTE